MPFRLKLKRKDKASPEDNKHGDIPDTLKHAVVTPFLPSPSPSPAKEPEKSTYPEPPQPLISPPPAKEPERPTDPEPPQPQTIPPPPKEPEKPTDPVPPQSQTIPPPSKEPQQQIIPTPQPQDQQLTGPVPNALGPALADNAEIQQIWAEIQEKVAKLAEGYGRSVDPNMEIDQVLETLESNEQADSAPSKRGAVKKAFGRTLTVIQKVGGFVADGASQVFPAAGHCYNAISFVINAWQGYQSAFDGLKDLFEECTNYLARLELYTKGKMSGSLTQLTAKQLRLFVEICEHAISLRRTARGKIKTALKIAFLGESNIQDLVAQMAKQVNVEHILVSAHIYLETQEAVATSRKNLSVTEKLQGQVSQVHDKVTDIHTATMKENEAHEQNRTNGAIKKALGYGNDIPAIWSDRYRGYLKERLPTTGKWVFDDPTFARWKKGQSEANILAIIGDGGTGKSFLATSIINHFIHRADLSEATDNRAYAAFYFLEGNEVQVMQSASNIEDVAKSLVWQFSMADGRYKRSAAGICREYQAVNPDAISRRLLFENPYLHDMNGMFYIIIDGLVGKMGEGMLRFLRDASAVVPGRHIRVLVTCDSQCLEHLNQANDIVFDPIHISAKNRQDVEALIESRMNDMPALNDCTNARVRELRQSVCHQLTDKTKGDYVRVNFALDDISKQEYPERIMSIVDNAGRERTHQIKEEIEELDRSLTDAEILEINDIILWIQHHRGLLTENQMTTALLARDGKESLLSLSNKFKSKYSLFTITNRGEVTFRAPEVEKAIPMRRRARNELEQHSPDAVSQGEIEMVKHFLRTVCPPKTYDKLDMDALLAQKKQDRGTRICQDDSNTGEAKLALTCLHLLTEDADELENGLLPYARNCFYQHLSAADLAFVDIELKVEIGQRLSKLFTNDTSIDALLCNRESSRFTPVRIETYQKLLVNDDAAKTVLRWLADSAVTSGVTDKETREWISDLNNGDGGHGKLLAPAAKRMAAHLVQIPHNLPVTRGAFHFLVFYIRKFEYGSDDPAVKDPFTAPIEEIEDVENWCANILGIQKKDSFWHSEISAILFACRHRDPAKSRARLALKIDPENWRASALLASKIGVNKGIELLTPVVDRLRSDDKWKQCDLIRSGYGQMHFILAELEWRRKQFDTALDFAKSAMRINPFDYPRDLRFLGLSAEKNLWPSFIEMLETIAESSSKQEHALSEMIILCIFDMDNKDYLPLMLQAACNTNRVDFLVAAFQDAVEKLETRGDRARLCRARYFYGRALNALHNGSSKAIEQWRKAIEEGADPHLLSALITNIAPYYLQKANQAAAIHDHESASINLEILETLLPEDVPESSVMLPPAIYIVRYHARAGNMAQAKLIARDIVRQGIEILTDDIEDNDLPAYNELMWLFIALGDMENVKPIRSLIATRFGEHQRFNCEGDCGGSCGMADEMIWCQDCINIKFEDGCHEKLHVTGFPFLFCNSTHKFLRLPKVEFPQTDCVPLGDELVPVDVWMQRLQRDYIDLVH